MSPISPPMKNTTAIAVTVLFAAAAFGVLMTLPDHKDSSGRKEQSARVYPPAAGKILFEESCTQCHTLPVFTVHKSDQWVVLVKKMNRYMQQTGKNYLSPDEADSVTRYILSNLKTTPPHSP